MWDGDQETAEGYGHDTQWTGVQIYAHDNGMNSGCIKSLRRSRTVVKVGATMLPAGREVRVRDTHLDGNPMVDRRPRGHDFHTSPVHGSKGLVTEQCRRRKRSPVIDVPPR